MKPLLPQRGSGEVRGLRPLPGGWIDTPTPVEHNAVLRYVQLSMPLHETEEPTCQPARTPRTLWIELTSKCPFDCVFCSRQTRRGAGEHFPFAQFERLVRNVVDPRKFLLNYSGESTVYPDLIPAIQLARSTGASVELVSVLATAPESILGPLAASGLDRLTVSVHATDPESFAKVYRYSSFDILRARLERFLELCRGVPHPPLVDLAFVAMDANLAQLPSVASFAASLGLRDIFLFPVMRRDAIPAQFPGELTVLGVHRPDFRQRVKTAVTGGERDHPQIRFTICNESFENGNRRLGAVPIPFPDPLPSGARIYSCEQNPWETAHVLSNGDVVACEVLDRYPLGNLFEQSLAEVWHGEPYRRFRGRYQHGEVTECQTCPWKRAYLPGPLTSEVIASRGLSAQLLYGWHEPAHEAHIWSSQQAMAMVAPRPASRTLHVSGMLPPGPHGLPNKLTIRLNGTQIGKVTNPWEEIIPFGLDFQVAEPEGETWTIEFRTTHLYRPADRGGGSDHRDLGFALVLLVSKEFIDLEQAGRRKVALRELVRSVETSDRWYGRLKRSRFLDHPVARLGTGAGLSVIIPERDNPEELTTCLASVREASERWAEPLETIVVVDGSAPPLYEGFRREHPQVLWLFSRRPVGFAGAVRAGLRAARYDWVYLLNNDMALDPAALRELAPCRDDRTFSIGSQIVLKDTTRFREETNWTTLLIESGLATIHDWIPRSGTTVETFYAGGGASLFHARLLLRLFDSMVYAPGV